MPVVEPGTTVFVVDDELEVRHAVADLVGLEGYEARMFSTADAAWTEIAVGGARPALIILDLWLEGMSSPEFVRRLRSSREAAIPVLVISSSRVVHAIESDVEAVVQKTIEATALMRAVDKLVRQGRQDALLFDAGRPTGPLLA